ncbi:MAG: hypothetical protein FD137_1763 [Spirochaetes bacterium]|nr:MAG: hypothetical protein FD137_1763 [Spirochaetota bacterium]
MIGTQIGYDGYFRVFTVQPGGEKHHFVNTGLTPFKFICLVPKSGDSY